MEQAFAYSTLALTVGLAVSRPRLGGLRFSPGIAAALGVVLLFAAGLLTPRDLVSSAMLQWRPLLALVSIMILTGVVQEVGAFDRLAQWIEAEARATSATRAFTLVFVATVVTPSLLNNDSAILLLTPLVIAVTRRLWPGRPDLTLAFAFVVFLAPGVAPFVVSNPMNMIVAEFAGIGWGAYARVMGPLSVAGAIVTYAVLRLRFRRLLASAVTRPGEARVSERHPAERPALLLLVIVFLAYPVSALVHWPVWGVSAFGALVALALAWRHRVASRRVFRHVSVDILVFLWGVFLVVVGLRHVGVVDRLAEAYGAASGASELAVVGGLSALGSAVANNHPMSVLNMMAIGEHGSTRALFAALVAGDLGPRLLPIGSLAGLLWLQLLRQAGVRVTTGQFVRLGVLVLVPTLAGSLVLLAWLVAG